MYWQYTTALASLVLVARNPPITSSAKNVNESFIWLLLALDLIELPSSDLRIDADQSVGEYNC